MHTIAEHALAANPPTAEIDPTNVNVYRPVTAFPAVVLTVDQVASMKTLEYFMSGVQIDTFVKNSTNCFYRITNATYVEVPRLIYNITQMALNVVTNLLNPFATVDELAIAANTISYYSGIFIQNMTNHGWVCNAVLKNSYMYTNARIL